MPNKQKYRALKFGEEIKVFDEYYYSVTDHWSKVTAEHFKAWYNATGARLLYKPGDVPMRRPIMSGE